MSSAARTSIPPHIRERMYEIMALTVRRPFPANVDPADIIKPHVWRNATYVGVANNHVQAWYGWSANLRALEKGYRTLYFDYVHNDLSVDVKEELFGTRFTQATAKWKSFVFLFVTSIPYRLHCNLSGEDLIFRPINSVIHPGYAQNIDVLLEMSPDVWSDRGLYLLNLQRALASPTSTSSE